MQQNTTDTFQKNMRPGMPPREGGITKTVEQYTAKLPSMTWLWAAVGAGMVSAGIAAVKNRKGTANFIGLWVPSLLLIGVYNKLVKIEEGTLKQDSQLH